MEPAPAHDRSHPLARLARLMAILNGLAAVVLVPAGLLAVWMCVYAVIDGNVDGLRGHALALGAAAGLLAAMGIGAWLLFGYIAVAGGRRPPRALWQASLAFNATGVLLTLGLWILPDRGATLLTLAWLVWPAAMVALSLRAIRLADAAGGDAPAA